MYLSEYEKKRLENIKRNKAVLKKLGLEKKRTTKTVHDNNKHISKPKGAGVTKKRKRKQPVVRRSSRRLKGVEATNYWKEKIIESHTVETKEEKHMYAVKKKKQTTDDIIKKSQEWLAETRKLITPIKTEMKTSSSSSKQASISMQAVEKWGRGVYLCPAANTKTFDWESYYISRLSTPSKLKSPMLLLQEFYNDCPWKLLCACALMSRVSSAKTKETALELFFQRYPNPTSCIDANPSEMHECIAPLGLFETRFRSIVEISRAFLSRHVLFNVGLTKEFKIYGIGEFGVDSYNIFCRDICGKKDGSSYIPNDKNLQAYCRWRKGV